MFSQITKRQLTMGRKIEQEKPLFNHILISVQQTTCFIRQIKNLLTWKSVMENDGVPL